MSAAGGYGGGMGDILCLADHRDSRGRAATSGKKVNGVDPARGVVVPMHRWPGRDALVCGVGALVRAAFPARSEGAMCRRAAAVLGCGENTVRRLLRGDTVSAPWPLVARLMLVASRRGVDPLAVLLPGHADALRVAA